MTSCVAIIPARYHSTRLPAKMLEKIGDRTLLQRVYENTCEALGSENVWIATDHDLIMQHAQDIGASYILTPECESGSDRVYLAAQHLGLAYDYILNIQGDAPFLSAMAIRQLADFIQTRQVTMGTLACLLTEEQVPSEEFQRLYSQKTKVVFSSTGRALFFSRSPIPSFQRQPHRPRYAWIHLGIYGYHVDALKTFHQYSPSPLEKLEGLEQLRWLEHDQDLYVDTVPWSPALMLSVDTLEDLEKARAFLDSQKIQTE